MQQTVKAGDTISVHYTGKFEDGNVFDSSEGRTPLKFTVGAGQLIPGFDDAVVGMTPGDKKTITVTPDNGYGERSEEYVIRMPKTNVPPDLKVEPGMMVQLSDSQGNPIPAVVVEVKDKEVILDANHPLAGKTLVFDIELVATGLDPDKSCDDNSCGSCCGSCGE